MEHKVEKLLYSRQDAAEALSVSVRSIDYLITTQRFPVRRLGGKIMIPAGALRRFAAMDHPGRLRTRQQSDSSAPLPEAFAVRFTPSSETERRSVRLVSANVGK